MRWLARLLLLRILPRRLVPVLAAWELFRLLRPRRDGDPGATQRLAPGPAARRPQPR